MKFHVILLKTKQTKNYHPYQGNVQPAAQVKVSHPLSTSYNPLLRQRKEKKREEAMYNTRKKEQETNEFEDWTILCTGDTGNSDKIDL